MKKILLQFFVFFALVSCSSSEDNSSTPIVGDVIGIWNLQEGVFNGSKSNSSQDIVEFTSDNRTKFTYKKYGNNGEDIFEYGSWQISGKTLTITWDSADPGKKTYVLEILELTKTNLKWKTVIPNEGTLTETFLKQ
jgi:hypothetical protein